MLQDPAKIQEKMAELQQLLGSPEGQEISQNIMKEMQSVRRPASSPASPVHPAAISARSQVFDEFLEGCHAMDTHFTTAPPERNLPMMMGLLGVWNANFLHLKTRAVFPYCEALWRLPAHIQQVRA